MTEQPLDLRRFLNIIGRRRALFMALFTAGVAVGLLFAILQTPTYVSRATVLLPPSDTDANGNELRDMTTEINIVRSSEIVGRAREAAGPRLEVEELQRLLSVEAVSDDILGITVAADSPQDAALLAGAIAEEYVTYSIDEASDRVGTAVSELKGQAAELEERIVRLDAEIASNTARLGGLDPGSAEALRIAAIIDSLRQAQVDAARQLSSVDTRIADAELSAALSRRGTRVLEAATVPDRPTSPLPTLPIAIGGAVGLVSGGSLAFVRDRRDRRLRTRQEVAEAVGVPVLVSLAVPKRGGVDACRALLRQWTASPIESASLRQALARLGLVDNESRAGLDRGLGRLGGPSAAANIVVVALAGDPAAVLLAAQFAAYAAMTGTRTAFIVATDHATAAHARLACKPVEAPVDGRGAQIPTDGNGEGTVRPHLCLHDLSPDPENRELECADLTVTVVVSETPVLTLPTWGRRTLAAIAVSSGFATADRLASVAALCQGAGHPVVGVFLANPDRKDRTTGDLVSSPPGTAALVPARLADVRTESA